MLPASRWTSMFKNEENSLKALQASAEMLLKTVVEEAPWEKRQ